MNTTHTWKATLGPRAIELVLALADHRDGAVASDASGYAWSVDIDGREVSGDARSIAALCLDLDTHGRIGKRAADTFRRECWEFALCMALLAPDLALAMVPDVRLILETDGVTPGATPTT